MLSHFAYSSQADYQSMVTARRETDNRIRDVITEDRNDDNDASDAFHAEDLLRILMEIRGKVDNREISYEEALAEYTNLISRFLSRNVSSVYIPAGVPLGRKLISMNMISNALDSADIIRTIGARFALDCSLDAEQFHREEANLNIYLRLAHDYYSDADDQVSKTIYQLEKDNINLSLLGIGIHDDEDFKEECKGRIKSLLRNVFNFHNINGKNFVFIKLSQIFPDNHALTTKKLLFLDIELSVCCHGVFFKL